MSAGTTIMRWAGAGSSDATNGNVAISNPDKIITTSMGQNLALSANTNQAHATLTPGQESYWHIASQFKAGEKLGKIHADATILGVALMGRPFVASDSDLGDLEIFEWCPVIGGTLRTDLKVACSVTLFKYSEVPAAHRLIGSFGGPGGRPDEDFGGLTRAQVVADNFGLAFRVRNNHPTETATYVCDQLCLLACSETADYDIVMDHNVTDETGETVSGRAPFFLHANIHGSAFKDQDMMRTHIRWRLITPSNDPINVTDRFRSGDTVVTRTRNLLTDVRGLIYACPLLDPGLNYLTAFIYEYGNPVPVASKTIAIQIEAASVEYFVNPSTGDNGNAGTTAGAAWETLPYAAANALDNAVIRVEGGHTYGRVATEFAQENIAIKVRDGTGTAIFENDGSDPSSWGVFTGDRVFLDLRNVTVADSTGNSYNGKNFAQITGDNYCIFGARGDGVGIPGFNRYGNNSVVQARFGLIDCDLYDTPVVTYFYFIGSGSGNASLGFFAGCWCKGSIEASSNGFARLGGPAANNTDASTGFSFLWCGIDGADGIAGGGDPWSFRLNGSLIQMFECGTTGTTIGAPEHFSPGSYNAYGNYGFLAEGCCCTPTVAGQKLTFSGHSRCYRDCVLDYRTNGESHTLAYLMTPVDMEVVNNTLLTDRNHPGGMIEDGVLPSFIPQTRFNHNIIIGKTATNGPNVKAYGDDGNAGVGAGYGSGSSPSHILEFTGNYWTTDGVNATDPVQVAGAIGAMSLLNTEYGGTNGISASHEADYPESDDWRPDVDATEAQTGSAIASPVDYRGVMRIATPSYLGAAGADASNPAFPDLPDAIGDLQATSGPTSVTLNWTPDGSGLPQVLMRKIDEGPEAGGYIVVATLAGDVTTYEDVEN